MKKILKFFVFLFFCFTIKSQAKDYIDSTHHFSFIIPFNWGVIPSDDVDNAINSLKTHTGNKDLSAVTGLYFKDNKDFFQYPFIMVSYQKGGGFSSKQSFSDLVKRMKTNPSKINFIDSLVKYNMSDFIASYNQNEYTIDTTKYTITTIFNSLIANYGELIQINKINCYKEGMITIYIYCLKSDFEKYKGSFDIVFNSFKFDKDYRISNVDLKNNIEDDKTISDDNKVKKQKGTFSLYYIFIFVIGITTIYFIRKKKSR